MMLLPSWVGIPSWIGADGDCDRAARRARGPAAFAPPWGPDGNVLPSPPRKRHGLSMTAGVLPSRRLHEPGMPREQPECPAHRGGEAARREAVFRHAVRVPPGLLEEPAECPSHAGLRRVVPPEPEAGLELDEVVVGQAP